MTDSVSRYYESMGRGKGAPYIDEKLNYAQTEPDLTEAVNKNIDAQIKDTQQFFADNIKLFNESIKVRDQAFKDAVSLTKSGIKMVKRYNEFRDNRNYLNNLDSKANDGDYMTKWNAAEIDFQKEEAKIDKDFEIEIGAAEKSINETGSYTFPGPDGDITITSDNLGSWKSSLLLSKGLTGSNAAQEANILAPAFWEIAKKDLLHSGTGLRYDELTDPDDKREWLEEGAAHFLGFVRSSNDRISDGDIIKHILPDLKSTISRELGVESIVQNSASNTEVSSFVQQGRASTIMGTINNSKSGNLNFNSVFDSENGMIQSITEAKIAQGLSPKAARKEALIEFKDAVVFAYENLGMEDDDYYHLINEMQFKHADGRMVTFAEMGGVWTETQVEIDRALNEVNDKRDLIRDNGVFTELKERYEENGTLISDQELQEFVGSPIFNEVAEFKNQTDQQAITGSDSDKKIVGDIREAVTVYVTSNQIGGDNELQVNRNISYMSLDANKDYYQIVQKLEKGNVDSAQARADAWTIVEKNITDGKYLNSLPNENVDYDPKKIYQKHATTLDLADTKGKQAWINSKQYHVGELKYAEEGFNQLKFGGDIPILYKNLAQFYPELDGRGLMVARLKALGIIKNEYDAFLTPLEGKIDSFSARNLTHNPTDAKTYQTILNSSKNFTGITEALLERPISKNMLANGGEDAVFTITQPGVEGGYKDENLSEMNVGDLLTSFAGVTDDILDDKRYGVYAIKGDNLKKLLGYMVENNIPIADRVFDRKFQDELMMLNLALEAQNKLTLNGDVSYLSMLPIGADESESYETLFKGVKDVDDDDNIWNEVRYLLRGAAQYKINLDLYGYDNEEEE